MTTRSRLITTVFRPDVWFVMPPACNVVFPEECTNVSYSRQMMRETTRLELQTFTGILESGGGAISEQLIQQYYFAPALVDGSGLPTLPDRLGKPDETKDSKTGATISASGPALTALMYDHEKFTGIIPKIERISDTAFYSALEANTQAGTASLTRDVPTIQQYAQRVALFNFLRNRYMARQASVSGRFMPRLVAGFPALVVNRPKETDTDDPTHFVGMITNVSHTLNQDGGTTSFALAYARPHTIASEEEKFLQFLQALDENVPATTTNSAYGSAAEADVTTLNQQLRAISSKMIDQGEDPLSDLYYPLSQGDYDAANIKAGEFGAVLFRPGVVASQFTATIVLLDRTDIVDTYTYTELFSQEPTDDPGRQAFRAAFGIAKDDDAASFALKFGLSETDDVEDLRSPDGNVYPVVLSFSLSEEAKTIKKSFEEIMTPPWFSDTYKNGMIGNYYSRLLGCTSMGQQFGGEISSVEAAARAVVDAYSALDNVKSNAGDPKFVHLNTRRSIPTQAEVLEFHRFASAPRGSQPLYGLDEVGGGVVEGNTGHIARNRVSTGDVLELEGAGSLDPRQERYTAVKSYQDQLLGRRAFRG